MILQIRYTPKGMVHHRAPEVAYEDVAAVGYTGSNVQWQRPGKVVELGPDDYVSVRLITPDCRTLDHIGELRLADQYPELAETLTALQQALESSAVLQEAARAVGNAPNAELGAESKSPSDMPTDSPQQPKRGPGRPRKTPIQ